MSSQDAPSSDRLALVNSFYGPGATACWYLTCLACLVSWTLHPQKSRSDSITTDLIALVTFPTVASAHLITQINNYPYETSAGDWTLSQIHASMAASLIITETYLAICVILLFVTILPRPRRVKRIVLLALTGIFCVISEVCLFFSIPSIRKTPGIFGRFFIVDSFPLLVTTLLLISILVALLLAFLYLLLKQRYPNPVASIPPEADPDALELYRRFQTRELHFDECPTPQMASLTYLSFLFLPMSFIASLISTGRDMRRAVVSGRRLSQEFFPSTDSGIMDLDQAVALLAGMTVFGFSLYWAADERYRRWWEAEKAKRERSVREMIDGFALAAEWGRELRAAQGERNTERGDFELQNLGIEQVGVTAI